ncbi:hypothetical protein TBLA_0A08650 [Henningerozyma blattae CBS 6284]|uniref:Uncharacterized protein n=1 Tax=Henningerozyma blattae (strain ATCC 34711 / CBS 6284 / DSM 70876 / NBRC 10599 / NRRL Y-10934 / UCD 77-7) TaxID=1071380 RepID=I2GX02_HENB6|nr:hypothetical protein TBLA_0A08650 [Tetrapisispora blattae CBS 6284]CCH58654.1 hypothetical protein TBLA_0A08650 [Tetrapisispora blattae CBS 6284]
MFRRNIYTTAKLFQAQLKKHLSQTERQDQSLFKRNKKLLEDMEFHSHKKRFTKKAGMRPSMEELKKMGDDARIEQNRPDDGVY